jgi:protein TonB
MMVVLTGCENGPPAPPPVAPHVAPAPVPVLPAVGAVEHTSFASIDAYKIDVAEQIMRANPMHTFSGRLPPMLPAIVVLTITVDRDGTPTRVSVQRSRDGEASNVALASFKRSGRLPKPFNLLSGSRKLLTFSETFLFNAAYQFQLRTLAGPQ